MAYILSKVGQSFNIPIHIYEADTEEDMNSIDIQSVPMGSKCHIINDDKWYMLNSDGKWKAMPKQVQPDWNQNDATQPDYVKNRPFYTGDPVETVLVEESTVSFAPADGVYTGQLESTFSPTVGETYKVSWDGTAYESTCVKFNNFPVIGNLSIMGMGSDTGEPFLAVVSNSEGTKIATADTSASHTFSISGFIPEIVKIDPKYIRDMYYTSDPVETVLVEENTVSFTLNEQNGLYVAQFPSTFEATVGETYKVSWDGAAYECACVNLDGMPVIGNLSIVGAVSDTGEPFVMGIMNGEGIQIMTADTSASHIFSISGMVALVVKIDKKYIPDEVIESIVNAQTAADNAQNTANSKMDYTDPVGTGSFSMGRKRGSVIGANSHAEGYAITASGGCSHAEGNDTTASSDCSHAEGINSTASGKYSHAECMGSTASGSASHAEGINTTALGNYSHAEGGSSYNFSSVVTKTNPTNSDIIGAWYSKKFSVAKAVGSHVEGSDSLALGLYSHAEGSNTTASGDYSHAEGYYTTASSDYQHVQGRLNVADSQNKYVHIVGNGQSTQVRSNAHTLDWNGVPWYQGRPQFGGTAQDQGSQTVIANGDKEIILASSTANSTKKFKITIDDSGTLTATEVT